MTDHTYADLCQTFRCSILSPDARPTPGHLTVFWCNSRPAELSLGIRPDGLETPEYWNVARSLFIAAALDFHRGAWAGGGDFAICYGRFDRLMLSFQPRRDPKDRAIVFVDAAPFAEFIDHTTRLVPPGDPESEITMRRVDEALEVILNDQ